jgi:SanA protein
MRMARRLFIAFVLVASIAAVLALAASAYVEHAATESISGDLDALEAAEAGLVLGSSQRVQGGLLNLFFKYRIDAASKLFFSGKVKYLIVSGNQAPGDYDEPRDMRAALIETGVPAARIYRDYAGFRTLDSILRAKIVFGQERVIVVSQRFHLQRALYIAGAYGLHFQGFEATDVPAPIGLKTKFREFFARIRAVGDVIIGRQPRYGGKAIVLGVDAPT